MNRRTFLKKSALGLGAISFATSFNLTSCTKKANKPNLVFVFADQWRGQATGYAGDPNANTPNLDKLAQESINFTNAISGCPVCSPYRASLLTGQYPLTHGIFYNDKPLDPDRRSIAEVYREAGYETGYIGKWHVDGHGRKSFIPRERRQGFNFWKVCECTHDYYNSLYYGDNETKLVWEGYDAFAQTKEAQGFIRQQAAKGPFILFLSWGPPHTPYHKVPDEYKEMYKDSTKIKLRPNVPKELEERARKDLPGYYAHIAALDKCLGDLLRTLEETQIADNTIFVFTSDHGDMLGSQGHVKKQKPWEESICVPFLLRYPSQLGGQGKTLDMPINTPDIMPTLLGLSGLSIPNTVEGTDFSKVITGERKPFNDAVLITCPIPFHQWSYRSGGMEYRGIRTRQYTYVKNLQGPWLLYDNKNDPYQLTNFCNDANYTDILIELEDILNQKLRERNDQFLSGHEYMEEWGYEFDANDL
jgi:arylsulfatase A-like enzyme